MSSEQEFLDINLKLNGKTVQANLYEELSLISRDNPDAIMEEMAKISSKIAFWGSVLAEAEYVYEKIQDEFEQWYAMEADISLNEIKRGKPASYSPNKDTILAHLLLTNKERYDRYKEQLRKAEQDVKILRRSYRAFEIRAEMLINIAAMTRTMLKSFDSE